MKHPTLDFGSGHDLMVRELEHRTCLELCLPRSLHHSRPSLCTQRACTLSLSLKNKINIKKKSLGVDPGNFNRRKRKSQMHSGVHRSQRTILLEFLIVQENMSYFQLPETYLIPLPWSCVRTRGSVFLLTTDPTLTSNSPVPTLP